MFAALILTAALTKPQPIPVIGSVTAIEQVIKKVDPDVVWKPCAHIDRCLVGMDHNYPMSVSIGVVGKDFDAILFGAQETSANGAQLDGAMLSAIVKSCGTKGSYAWVGNEIDNWIASTSTKKVTYARTQIGDETLVFSGVASDALINLEIDT